MPIDKSIDYSAITPEIKALTKLCLADNVIEPEMYVKYAVNRGLRDLNGNGEADEIVLTSSGLGNVVNMLGNAFGLVQYEDCDAFGVDADGKVYAEKLLYLREGQYAPNHFHWFKTEDIINRGGGNVLIRVYNRLPNEEIDYESDVEVHTDGKSYTVPAGTQIRLKPGESIFVYQGLYHDFSVEPGTGPVLLGEVSQCNDDNTDNRFNPPVGRFPKIEEDEPPYRLLCNEYPAAKD